LLTFFVLHLCRDIIDGCTQLYNSLIEVSPCCLRRKILINRWLIFALRQG
jgi:hypothetical protein